MHGIKERIILFLREEGIGQAGFFLPE